MALRLGNLIGSQVISTASNRFYRIHQRLGAGQQAVVFKATDEGGQPWAVKVYQDLDPFQLEEQELTRASTRALRSGWNVNRPVSSYCNVGLLCWRLYGSC